MFVIRINYRNHIQEQYLENWINEENNITEENNEYIEKISDDAIGILKIPILNIEEEIAEGTNQTVLSKYIGHFENSDIWDGTVALASHNRGENVLHCFENINKLNKEDLIVYITKYGIRKYKVYEISAIKQTDWSFLETNSFNQICLITCVKGNKDLRLCVNAKEYK